MKKQTNENHIKNDSANNPTKTNRKILLIGITTVVAISAVCILTGCFSSVHKKPQPAPKPPIEKPDNTKEFRDIWNETISKIKYKNTHLDVNFNKYKVGSDPQHDLSRLLSFNHQKLQTLKSELKVSKNTFMIKPFISWIDAKEKISYSKPSEKLDSDALMHYVSKIVRPDKSFSRNTIDTVVQLNEFCYYFERNKDRFYREGYTRNVKGCGKIEKILSANGIKYKMY